MILYGILYGFVRPDDLLHPDHIVPAAKLVRALVELPDPFVAHMRVKVRAVRRQILVRFRRPGNTGVEIPDSLLLQALLQSLVERPAQTPLMDAAVKDAVRFLPVHTVDEVLEAALTQTAESCIGGKVTECQLSFTGLCPTCNLLKESGETA